jgi:hypothetical protein
VGPVAGLLGHVSAVDPVPGSVTEQYIALGLADLDLIFGCTDNLASRRLLNRLALQYYIPFIDLGVDLEAGAGGSLRTAVGRVTVVLPDGPCLHRAEVLRGSQEAFPGYVRGSQEQAPAVIAFNGVTSSLAVSVALSVLGAFHMPEEPRQLLFRPATARVMQEQVVGLCAECLDVVGVGDSLPLPWDWPQATAL